MGSQQQYCLRWNNHQSNILSVFDSLFQNEAMVDVTLACEGLSIKAHKMVLSACSPYFQSLFMENPCKHPIVILKDVSFADLKALMDFMYRGEVNVNQEQLDSLLKTAETLKVRGLTEVATNAGDLQNSMLNQEREVTHLPPHHLAGIAPPQPSTHPTLVHTLNRSSPSPKRRKKMPDQQKANPSPSPSELEDSDNVIEPKIEIKESQQSNELMSKIIQAALVQTGSAAGGAFQSSLVHSDQAPSGAFQSNGSQGLPSANDASPSVDQNFTVRPNEAVPQLLYKSSLCQPPGMQGDKVKVKSKKTVFNNLWLDETLNPEFAGWLRPVKDNRTQAYCIVCCKTFELSNMGRQAIVSHAKRPRHNTLLKAKYSQLSFASYVSSSSPSSKFEVGNDKYHFNEHAQVPRSRLMKYVQTVKRN